MKELKQTAQTLEKVFRILKIALDIALVALLVGLLILAVGLVVNPAQIGQFSGIIELGFVELKIADAYMPDQKVLMLHAGAELLAALAYIWAARIAVKRIQEILKPMAAGEPFGGIVSEKLKQLSSLSLLLWIVSDGIGLISQAMMTGVLDLQNLLLSEKVAHVSFNYELNLTFLLIFAAFRLLSYVFRYGEELQQLSDKTP